MTRMASCDICGRLDPWRAKPCCCQKTTMHTKEKDILLFYEHHTDGHPFGIPKCPVCSNEITHR